MIFGESNMIEVEILLPPIAVGDEIHETVGEIIKVSEADIKRWEQDPNPVAKRVQAAESQSAMADSAQADDSGTPESTEKPAPAKKR